MNDGVAVWVSGANDVMVSRVAEAVAARLVCRQVASEVIDARTPGIDALAGPDMDRRVAVAAALRVRHGITVVVAVPSPSRAGRDEIRALVERLAAGLHAVERVLADADVEDVLENHGTGIELLGDEVRRAAGAPHAFLPCLAVGVRSRVVG